MKAKVFIIVLLMGLTTVLVAQPKENGQRRPFIERDRVLLDDDGHRGPMNGLNLTAEQKEAFKQSKLALQKQLHPLRNELGEAVAHQKTLTTAEKPDITAINKNIEKIGELRVEMAKIQAKHRLDRRAQLTDEQRLKFDMFKEKMKHERGTKGKKHEMKM